MKNLTSVLFLAAMCSAFLSLTHEVSAATTYTWVGASGGGDGLNMSDANNWSPGGGPPTTGDTIIFSDAAGVETAITVDTAFSLDSVTFDGNALSGITLSGSTITLTAGGGTGLTVLSASTDHTMANNVNLGASQNWDIQSGRTFTLSGVLGDGGSGYSLTSIGSGKLILSGANTFSGALNVNAGVVSLRNSSAIASSSGAAVTSGAALELQGGVSIGAVPLTINGGGVSTDGGLRSISGVNSYAGAITLGSASRINTDADSLTLTGGMTGTGNALAIGGSGNTTISTSGINTGAGGTLTKDGTGRLTNSASGNYDGLTTINAGVVNVQNDTALGTTAAGVNVTATGAALELQGGRTIGAEAVTLNGSGVSAGGALRSVSGNNSLAGAITLGSASRINSDLNTLTLTGAITGTGNALTVGGAGNTIITNATGIATGAAGTLVKDGTGTLSIFGVSTLDGNTSINGGTVRVTNESAFGPVPAAAVANQLVFSGGTLENTANMLISSNRGITMTGNGTFLVNAGLTNTVSSQIAGAGNITNSGTGALVLGAANSNFTGNVFVNAGTVFVSNAFSLGTNTVGTVFVTNGASLVLNGQSVGKALNLSGAGPDGLGVLVNNTGTPTLAGAITLPNGGSSTISTIGGSTTLSGPISGGTLVKVGGNTLTLTGSSPFTGSLVIGNGTVAVSGNSGQLSGVSRVTIGQGAALTLGSITDAAYLDRIKDGSPIVFNRSTLNLNGPAVAGLNQESLGSDFVLGNGLNTITLTPALGREVELATDVITRNNNATLLLRGTALGSNGNNSSRFFVTNTPPTLFGGAGATDSKNISIVPWIAGDSVAAGNGTNFVTYGASGFRPLNNSTEYDLTTMSGVTGNNNYNTAGELFTNGSATINALRLVGGTVDLANTNSTLTIGSGAIMFAASSTIQNGKVAFGANEGVIHLSAGAAVTGTLNSMVSGTGGLTVSSSGTASTLTLGGMNTLTGPVTINSSTVNIANDFNLGTAPGGATPGSIVLASGTLNATADMALNANRGILVVSNGVGGLSVAAGNTMSYNGIIASSGGTNGVFTKSGAGTLSLTGVNTYSGPTTISAGRLQVNADSGLGNAPAAPDAGHLTLSGGGTLVAGSSFALDPNRSITITGAGQMDVPASANTLTVGPTISGTGGFAKLGSGTLLVTNANTLTGNLTNSGGTLTLVGNNATFANAASLTVQSNSSTIIGSTADTTVLDRLSNSAVLNMAGGSFSINGADNLAPTVETIGTLTNTAGFNTLTLTPAATREVQLSTTNLLARTGSATLLVRGDSLGATGPGSSRVLFNTAGIYASATPTNFFTSGTNVGSISSGGFSVLAGTTTNAIINFMVGDTSSTGSGNTFVTYDVNGLRPLNTATELEAGAINNSVSGAGGNIGNTNFTTGGETLTGNRILNSLRVTGGTLNLGAANLTNYSGAVLFTGAASITNGTLFMPTVTNTTTTNNVEGIISLHAATPFTAAIGAAIGGSSNQLTVSGNNPNSSLILAGANTFSNLVVNTIKVGFSNDSAFGLVPGAASAANITLAGGTLSNSVSVTIGSTRGMTLANGSGTIETPTGTTLTYGGIIAGAGQGLTKNGAGTLALSGANTFTGSLVLNGGVTVASGSTGALGAGNVVLNSGGTLQMIDDTGRLLARAISINGNQTLLATRSTPGAGSIWSLGATTLGNALTGGQTLTLDPGTNVLTGNQQLTLGVVNMTNTSGSTTFTVNTNGNVQNTILNVQSLTGTGDVIKNGAGTLVISNNNGGNFTGNITVNAGTLQLNNAGALGISGKDVTINSGATLDFNGQVVANEQAITVGGSGAGGNGAIVNNSGTAASFAGAVIQTAPVTYNGSGVLTNRGGIQGNFTATKQGSGTLVLAGTNTFAADLNIIGGTVQLAGPGLLTAATGVTVNNTGTLIFGNGLETNNVNRLGDAVAIGVNRGAITVNGANAAGGNVETLGTVTLGGGNNTFTVNTADGQSAGLTVTTITRNSNSVLFARGDNLGSTGADAAQIILSAGTSTVGGGGATGTRNQSIVPWIVGATNGNEIGGSANFYGPTFVTTGATGLRALNPFTEMSLGVVNPNSTTANASFGSTESIVSNQTVNALRIVGGVLDVQQNRTLTVTSGAIIASFTAGTIGNNINAQAPYSTLAFGANEGVIQLMIPTNGTALTINANITGTGGLTVGSFTPGSALVLSGSNTFTGNITLNGAGLTIRTDGNLGNAANKLVLAGGTLNVNQDYNLSRTVVIGAGGGTLTPAANTSIILNGTLSSIGTNTFTKAGTGALLIQTGLTPTINGPLNVAAGALFIGNEAQIGGAPGSALFGGLTFNGGTLVTTNTMSLSANRQVNLNGAGTFDVASGTTLTENGSLTGGGVLTKQGAGTLIIANVASNTAAINVNNGTLAVQGNNAQFLAPGTITVQSNAILTLGSTADTTANPNRIADNAALTLNNGLVNLNGSADASSTVERVGTLTFGTGYNSLTLTPGTGGGGQQLDFNSSNVLTRTAGSGATALVRGTSLGTNGASTSRILYSTTPTNFLVSGTNGGLGSVPFAVVNGATTNAIVPFLVGDNTGAAGNGNTFVTYGTNGLRPLAEVELGSAAGALNNAVGATGTTGTNVTTGAVTITTGAKSVNSLRVTGGTVALATFTVTNSSGAVLFTGAGDITNGTLRFPTNLMLNAGAGALGFTNVVLTEGVISLQGAASFTAGIGAVIAGNTNVTVSGNNAANTLVLAGANSFTNLIVNNTRVSFLTETNLGGGTITLAGGTLTNRAAASISAVHNIVLGNSGGTLDTGAGNLTVSSGISGAQNLTKVGANTLILGASNAFTGSLVINGGAVRGTVTNSLGAGNIVINAGNLELINDTQIGYGRAVILGGSTTNIIGTTTAIASSTNTMTLGALTLGNQRLSVTNGGLATSGTNILVYGTVTVTNSGAIFSVGSGSAANPVQLTVGAVNNQGYNVTLEAGTGGRLLVSGNVSGTGGLTFNGPGTNVLAGDNSAMAGDVTVNSGTLLLTNANAIRLQNRLTVASGATVEMNAVNAAAMGEINGTGVITNSFSSNTVTLNLQRDLASGPTTVGVSIGDGAGAGGLTTAVLGFTKSGTGLATLTNSSPFSGALTVTGGNSIFTTTEGGELRIQGNNARITGANSITINQGGTLTVGSSADTIAGTAATNRLADRATLSLTNGLNNFNLNGPASVAGFVMSEVISNISVATGLQTITLNPASGTQLELVASNATAATGLVRGGNATLLLRGTGLGIGKGTNDSSRLYFTGTALAPATNGSGGATGSKTISIFPWLIGDTNIAGTGTGFVTYTATAGAAGTNGFRPLTDAEYESVNNLGSAAKTIAPIFAADTFALTNFTVGTSGQTLAGSLTPVINSVRIGGGTVDVGTGRVLTVDSGAILMTNNTTITGGTLLFNREAVIHSMSSGALANTINSVIAGTGGVTFSANNPGTSVTLGGNNIFVGTVNINGDPLIINNAGALNSFTPNSVTINSGRLSLNGNSITINALNMNGAAIIDNGAAGNATLTVRSGTFNGLLADGNGAGTLTLVKSGTGTFSLVANNTSFANSFTGGIVLNSGTLQYGSDHALGNGTLVINGGTLNPAGNNGRTIPNPIRLGGNLQYGAQNATTFQGPLDLGGAVRALQTGGGQAMTFNGPISNGGFIKDGNDTVTLGGTNNFDDVAMIIGGAVALNGPSTLGSTSGATLVLGGLLANDARIDLNGQASFSEALIIGGGGNGIGVAAANGALGNSANTNVQLNGPVTLTHTTLLGSTNMTFNNVISGPGGLVPNTTGTVTLTGSNTFTGPIRVDGGTLTVSGNAASVAGASHIAVGPGNALNIGATGDTASGAINRIRDTATVGLTNATLQINSGATTTEAFDTLAIAGRSTFTLNSAVGALLVTNNNISRGTGATLLLRGPGLGTLANSNRYAINSANLPANFQIGGGGTTGSQNQNIVPWVVGDNAVAGVGTNFVTYSNATGTGFRVLADSELFATNGVAPLAGAAPVIGTNFLTIFGFTNAAGAGNHATVNALKWATASTITNGTGIGTNGTSPIIDLGGNNLTNNSGAFLFVQVNTNTGFTLTNGTIVAGNDGNREIIYHVVSVSNNTVITNWVSLSNASGGFTYSPNQSGTTLRLTNNSITGAINIDNGIVILDHPLAFGTNMLNTINNQGVVNFNGFNTTNGGLNSFIETAIFSNSITGPAVTLTINTTNFDTYAGVIGSNISVVKTGFGTQVLTGAGLATTTNSFSNLTIQAGTVIGMSNANALGGGTVFLDGGNLALASINNVNFARPVQVRSNATITLNSLATLTGITETLGAIVITNNPFATTLTLTGASSTSGNLQLNVPSINLTNASTNFTLLVNNNGLGATTVANITSGVQLGTNTFTVDGTGNVTIAGATTNNTTGITNADAAATPTANRFGLVKQGTGTLTLTGTNYFTNDIAVLGGTLRGQSNGAFGLSTNRTAIVLGGGNLTLANVAATAFRQNVTLSNDSSILVDRTALGAGITHSLSNLLVTNVAGNYTLTVTGTNGQSGNMGVSFVTNILASGNNINFNVVSNSGQNANTLVTLAGLSGPADSSVTKSGNGSLTINGNNITTFLGTITNNSGILTVGATGGLGNTNGTFIASGATLDLNGINVTNENITIGGAGLNGLGTLISGTGTGTAGNLTFTNDTTFGGAGGLLLSNFLATPFNFTKVGAGTLQMSGATNTYTGTWDVQQGTLQANTASAFGSSVAGISVAAGAAVNLNGQNVGNESITMIQGSGPAGLGALQNGSATSASIRGTVSQMGATVYSVAAAGNLTNVGAITGIGGVIKSGTGAGSWTLTASNTYRGETLVNGGLMSLSSTNGSALSSHLFIVQSNAVLTLGNVAGTENNGNRIGDCIEIRLQAGTFAFTNNASTANFSEQVGPLRIVLGANTVAASQAAGPGNTSILGFENYVRSNGSTLNFLGLGLGGASNQIRFTETAPALDAGGMIGGYATVNFADFATYATNGAAISVTNISVYNTGGEATWVTADNAKVTAGDTLTAARTINSLTLQSGAAQTLNLGGNTLTVTSGGILAGGANVGITNGTLTAGPNGAGSYELVSIVSNNIATAIGAVIADNGANPVSVVLAGQSLTATNIIAGNNTFTGGATINSGTVQLANTGALNTSGTNTLTINGGLLDLNNNSVTVSALNGNGLGTITNLTTVVAANQLPTTLTINSTASNRFDGIIAGTNVALVKNGPGIQSLAGANTYTGQTVVNAGVVNVMANAALGASGNVTNNTTVLSGAAIHVDGTNLTVAELTSLQGTGISGGGALRNLGNTNTWSGALTILTNGARINSDAGQFNLTGTINNGAFNLSLGGAGNILASAVIGAGAGTVTKDGTGTLTLTAANTFTGGFSNNAGVTLIGNAAALGAAGGTVALNGGTLASQTNSAFTIANPIVIGGDITLGQAIGGTGALTFNNQVDLGSGTRTLTINNSSNIFSGVVIGTGGITKEGTGALYLGGINVFTGPVNINNGSIIMTSAGAFNTGSNLVTVGSGGTLTLNGNHAYLGSLAGSTGGIVENANAGSVLLNLNQTLNTSFNGTLRDGTGADSLSLVKNGTGNLTLGGSNSYSGFTILNGGTLTLGAAGALGTNQVVFGTQSATLDVNGQTSGTQIIENLAGSGATGTGALVNNSATPGFVNGIINQGGNTVYGGTGILNLNGNITGVGGFTKTNTGTVVLSGSNIFSSFVSVNGGTLRMGSTNGLGGVGASPVITITNGATLDLNGFALASGKNISAIGGAGVGGNGALINSAVGTTATNSGNILMVANTTFGGTADLGLGGVISGTNFALIKTGTNTLILGGANLYTGGTLINQGVVRLGNAAALSTTPSGTFIAPGATLDLNGQANVAEPIFGIGGAGMSGNGALVNNGGTITYLGNVVMTNDTVFGGTGILSMAGAISGAGGFTKAGASTINLTATNGYSGATVVNAGSLVLNSNNGVNLNSLSYTINSNAVLTLNNTTSTNANRINDAATLTMNGGSFNVLNTAGNTTGLSETLGALSIGRGNNIISNTASAGNSILTFDSLARTVGSTLEFDGAALGTSSNQIVFTTAPQQQNGIIAGWATGTNFSEFVKYAAGSVTPLVAADYSTGIPSTWNGTQNVKVSADQTLTSSTNVNSLNIQSAARIVLSLGGRTLTNETGGILVSGGTGHVLTNGALTAGTNFYGNYELITIVSNNVFFTNSATIVNNTNGTVHPVSVVFGGQGTTILRGTNTFTGGVTVNSGTLALTNIGNLGTTNALVVNGGTLALGGITVTNSSLNGVGGTITGPANSTLIITNTDASSYSGIIAGSTVVTKRGSGSLTLSGVNTFTGALTVSNGTFIAGNPAAFGSTTGGTVIGNGAMVDLNGQFISIGENLNLGGITGSGIGGAGAMVNNSTTPAAWRGQFQMGTNTTTVGGTGDFTITGSITGTNKLIKVGANTLILSGGTNTWSGGLQIDNGVVRLDNAVAINPTNVVTMNGGTLRLNGNSTVVSNLAGLSGTIENNAVGTNATLTVSNEVAGSYSGIIADGAAGSLLNFVKTNVGALTLGGVNTYTGTTVIGGGTLIAGSSTALGSTVGGTTIGNGATLDLGGQTIGAEAITSVSGTGVGGLGALVNNSSTAASFGGTVAMTGNTTIGGTGYATLGGVVSGAFDLTQGGTGTNALSAANTYTGNTYVNTGALNVQNALALGTTNNGTTVASGAALEVQGSITTAEPMTLSGDGISSGGALRNISGANTVTGRITLGGSARINSDNGSLAITGSSVAHTNAGARTLTLGGGSSGFLDVSLGDNGASATSIVKDGAGTWTLSKPNTFSGSAAINNGTLVAQGTGVLGGTSQITVSAGGTLMLSGTGDRIKDSAAVTLAGGTFSTVGLSETVGVLTLSATSIIDLGAGASILRFDDSSAVSWTGGALLNIYNWTGSFDGWSSPGGGTDQIYFGNNSNSMAIAQGYQIRFFSDNGVTPVGTYGQILCNGEVVPVPEPATWIAMASVLALLAWRERSRLAQLLRAMRRTA